MHKKMFLMAQLLWFFGLALCIALDALLRFFTDRYALTTNESLWFFIHGLLFFISLLLTYKSIKHTTANKKVVIIAGVLIVSGVYYTLITGFYVIATGIDSL